MPIKRYNRVWPTGVSEFDIERLCFKEGIDVDTGGLGKAGHLKRMFDVAWGDQNPLAKFKLHPWAEDMTDGVCRWPILGITGCASSGKSDFSAAYGINYYLADPRNTCVLVTSTSISAAKKRVWGSVTKYWNALPDPKPGKLVESGPFIRFEDPTGTYPASDKVGIHLIACEPKKDKQAIAKLIGFKADRMLLIGDEFCELSPALLEAALSNLTVNPEFQLIALGNFSSIYDPLGIVCEPEDGWGTIHPDMEGWKTKMGYCLHFDAEKSPNVTQGKTVYPFLPTKKWIEEQAERFGENSYQYWRMVKGFPAPEGAEDGLYSEADFIIFDAGREDIRWIGTPTPVAGLDLSFTAGGDGCCACFALLGNTQDYGQVLLVKEWKFYSEDRRAKKTRSRQIAEMFMRDCQARGIRPEHAGYDSSGTGGKAMGDSIAEVWSGSVYACDFSGAPSSIPVGVKDKETAADRFFNRVSELWGVGVDFLRSHQIKGVKGELGKQMAARKIKKHRKSGDNLLMQVEEKPEMRKRTNGQSPDIADAFFIALDLCRFRFKFRANVVKSADKVAQAKWKGFVNQMEEPARNAPGIAKNLHEAHVAQSKSRGWSSKILQIQGGGWGNARLLR